jgi:L-asparaginase/Glu-tRNA(Gln) amidotransferase subunit D
MYANPVVNKLKTIMNSKAKILLLYTGGTIGMQRF